MSGRRVLGAAGLAVVLFAVGCTGSSTPSTRSSTAASGCGPIVADLVNLTQRYLDGVAADTQIPGLVGSSPSPSPSPAATPSVVTEQQYADAISGARQKVAAAGCSQAAFNEGMQTGLRTVRPRGAVASAVLSQLRAQLSGNFPTSAVTRTAAPGDDLAAVFARLPARSTLNLAAGTYHLPDTLVILRPVTVHGVGPGQTVLTSTTADAAVLVLTDQPVNLTGLALRRTGAAAGSVVVTGPATALTFRQVAVSGARADSKGTAGGVGVLLTAVGASVDNKGVTFSAVDSSFSDNDAAGIAAGGTHQAVVSGSTFARDRQCGICYLGSSSGTISRSTFTSDVVGVVVSSAGAVSVKDNHFRGGQVGVQATGASKPSVTGNVIAGAARAAMVFVDTSAGTVDGNDCSGNRAGIAVARSAYPLVKTNSCRVTLG